MSYHKGENFVLTSEEEEEKVTCVEHAPPCNQPSEMKSDTLSSLTGLGIHQKWKTAIWSPVQLVTEAEGKGGSSQAAELKAI